MTDCGEETDYPPFQGVPFLRRYRWYRWLLGGRWVNDSELHWYARWVRVGDNDWRVRVDEDWR